MEIKIQNFYTEELIKQYGDLPIIPRLGEEIVINSTQYDVEHIRFDMDRMEICIYVSQLNTIL